MSSDEALRPRPASEILNVSIGGFTTMRLQFLQSASKETGARIPVRWSSNRCYEELEREGLVSEVHSIDGWTRRWMITDAGRKVLGGANE